MAPRANTALFLSAACLIWQVCVTPPVYSRAIGHESRLTIGDSEFLVNVKSGSLKVTSTDIDTYVRDAARAVVAYYGSFPVDKTIVVVAPTEDDGVGFATSTHEDAGGYGLIEIDIGRYATPADLNSSWTLTHEMMHLAFPIMERRHRWLAEGIATYAEPIGRMRIGRLTREEMWGDLADNLYKGLPAGTDDGGLNKAQGFRRVYWGGALYCLLADIAIRKRTNNKMGLEQALRAITNKGGNASSDWSAEKSLRVGDEAVGVKVLQELYAQMSETPRAVDISKLLRELGIKRTGKETFFDNRAPLASIRLAIEGRRMRLSESPD